MKDSTKDGLALGISILLAAALSCAIAWWSGYTTGREKERDRAIAHGVAVREPQYARGVVEFRYLGPADLLVIPLQREADGS